MTLTRIHWTRTLENELWDLHEENPGWPARRLANELGLPYKAVDNRLYCLKATRGENWLDYLRIGFFDIETTNLKVNVGHMLSWALRLPNGTVRKDLITPEEIHNYQLLDKRIVRTALASLNEVDCIVTYNGRRFDVPFLRGRAMDLGLKFPSYGSMVHLDMFVYAKEILGNALTNKRMGTYAEFMRLEEQKDHYDVRIWNMARHGHAPSLKKILSHNVSDVKITDLMFNQLRPFAKWTRRSL